MDPSTCLISGFSLCLSLFRFFRGISVHVCIRNLVFCSHFNFFFFFLLHYMWKMIWRSEKSVWRINVKTQVGPPRNETKFGNHL
uniref:Uncharacterized protein n=1 Tax=Rhizophora mucronata TaxID=61149 RepID=A0A2P2NAH7_RHIMU